VSVLEHFRDKILSANGVPGSIVGLVQDVNRAAAETNQFIFENTTIKPIADLIANALISWPETSIRAW
jgi:capsid portal protein